jgi:hypothetical protein
MNIFVLDLNPEIAAQLLFDKHVVKMALETAQILSTINGGPYKSTHEKHPCTLWASSSLGNYNWLFEHGIGICNEYRYRYNKEHKCEEVIYALQYPVVKIPSASIQSFALCMPNEYKQEDPVKSYQSYYKSKASFANWTKRPKPEWWNV